MKQFSEAFQDNHVALRAVTGLVLAQKNHHICQQACWSPASGAWARENPTPDGAEATEEING
ncbi:hypothetical protein [Mesorhizobium sp. KR2-14]|uniref:hypothetical protein n=1 Tax=Mesorhizobium sp. KR2-14 TaxID=3156610 RepID=UPI0032B46FCB